MKQAYISLRVKSLKAAEALEKLADSISSPNEAAIHRKSAEIIRILAEQPPVHRPVLRLVKK